MARRKARTRTRYRTRVKRVYSRGRSIGGGKMKNIIDGTLAGVGAGLASKYLGPWGNTAAYIGVGMYRKNATLSTLGGVQLGQQLSGMIPGFGGNGSTGTGFFQS